MKSFPHGFIENETIYRNAWAKHPARKIGVVKDIDFSIDYFESNFEKFKSQVDLLAERVSQTENKGSYHLYPLSKTPLVLLLDKEYLINKGL